MRVISRIRKNPSQASRIKLDHFSNIGVIEVFLEAVPTAFILVAISIVGLVIRGDNTGSLAYVLIGSGSIQYLTNDLWSFSLFCLSCATSLFSAGFGMAR